MTKKSKLTLGLKEDSSNRSNRRYSEQEKHSIIQEMISSGCTKNEIWQKYTGYKDHGQITRWMRKLGYNNNLKSKKFTFAIENIIMQKKKVLRSQAEESLENLQFKKRVEELEKQLKDAEMKAVAYSTMVDIAEKEFNIQIRKKFNTKPSK